jgi:hypothetical protein
LYSPSLAYLSRWCEGTTRAPAQTADCPIGIRLASKSSYYPALIYNEAFFEKKKKKKKKNRLLGNLKGILVVVVLFIFL